MKRSRINKIMAEADEMIRLYGFTLPPFAYWTPDEFRSKADIARHVIDARCGWDITDYGEGCFDEMGLFLFTLRNGLLSDLTAGRGMCYAEKLLISRQDQLSPMHTHVIKAEDIINRGGATMVIELFGSDDDGNFARLEGCHIDLCRTGADLNQHVLAHGRRRRDAPPIQINLLGVQHGGAQHHRG